MNDVELQVQRAVDGIQQIAKLAARVAGKVFVVAAIAAVAGFALGVKALSGGMQSVWYVLAGGFGLFAIGAAALAWWRTRAAGRHVPELANELRSLASQGAETGRKVFDTFTDESGVHHVTAVDSGSAIQLGRHIWGFKGALTDGAKGLTRLGAVTSAVTSFPLLVLAASAIAFVFVALSVVFLLALAIG